MFFCVNEIEPAGRQQLGSVVEEVLSLDATGLRASSLQSFLLRPEAAVPFCFCPYCI
jgi:hypothetical protein